ncbi:hypothetical protein EH227_16570 [Rouxiella chamberiensis]|nr:hypothetical protein EH227_16570 [Rouxiella chamberiensis]
MNNEDFIEFFSCRVCKCEFLKRPEVSDFDEYFIDVSCASCGRKVTKMELILLFHNRSPYPPKKLDTSMFK